MRRRGPALEVLFSAFAMDAIGNLNSASPPTMGLYGAIGNDITIDTIERMAIWIEG